jgi:hypothetical protein
VATTAGGVAVTLVSVSSRKVHGNGTFDLPIALAQNINGAITVEPRPSSAHALILTFSGAVSVAGTPSLVDAASNVVGTVSATASGNQVIVTITGLPDNQRVTVSLANVNNAGVNASIALGFLGGDVNVTRSVTASDILRVKGMNAQAANSGNYFYDTDLSGAIDAADVTVTKARAGSEMP